MFQPHCLYLYIYTTTAKRVKEEQFKFQSRPGNLKLLWCRMASYFLLLEI